MQTMRWIFYFSENHFFTKTIYIKKQEKGILFLYYHKKA